MSEEGPQQGDPLGPLLFCSTIHPLITSLSSGLTLGYLDNLTLAGPQCGRCGYSAGGGSEKQNGPPFELQ